MTVIIPTFNRADLVQRAVSSALSQRTTPFEILVADDGSSDATLEVLRAKFRAEPSVRVLALPHRGVSATRNAAARLARGRFLAFLDSDDELEADWLSSVMGSLTDGVGLVRTDGLVQLDDGRQHRLGPPGWRGHYPTGAVLPGTWAVGDKAFEAVGGYDEHLTFSENTELLIRVSKHCREVGLSMIERTDAHVVVHRRGGRAGEYGLGPALAAERMLHEHADVFARDAELRQQYLAILGTGQLRAGRRTRAVATFARSWAARPASLAPPARLMRAVLLPHRPTRPLVVIACPGAGRVRRGYESFAIELHDYLRRTGHNARLLGGRRAPDTIALPLIPRSSTWARWLGSRFGVSSNSVEHYSFGLLSLPWLILRRPDLIIVSERPLANLYARASRRLGSRGWRVLFSNGGPSSPPFDAFDGVHHVSPLTMPEGAADEARPAHFLVPYAIERVPEDMTQLEARAHLGLPSDRSIVVSVGALDATRKRMDHVVREVSRLPAPRALLLLVGQPTEESENLLDEAAELLGASGVEMRTLDASDVHVALRASDAFVLASTNEGFGRVYVEALGAGLRCVVHDGEVMRFVLGEHGTYVNMDNPGEAADALQEVLGRQDDADARGARIRSAQRFSWDVLGPRYEEMIDAVSGVRP